MRRLGYLMGAVALLLAANATNALAVAQAVPEISPASLSGGIGLLVSGALLVRARFGK